jgi:hypothetical protein
MNPLHRKILSIVLVLFTVFTNVKSTLQKRIYQKIIKTTASFATAVCLLHPEAVSAGNKYYYDPPVVYPASFGKVVTNDIKCQMREPDLPRADRERFGQNSNAALFLEVKQDLGVDQEDGRSSAFFSKNPPLFTLRVNIKDPVTKLFPTSVTLESQLHQTKDGIRRQSIWQAGKFTFL